LDFKIFKRALSVGCASVGRLVLKDSRKVNLEREQVRKILEVAILKLWVQDSANGKGSVGAISTKWNLIEWLSCKKDS
jgi:hypothetical protein